LAHGCETVLTSKYAVVSLGIFGVGNVPLSLIGVLYFVVLIGFLLVSAQKSDEKKNQILSVIIRLLVTSGLIVSIILIGIQAFVLHAFCQYCLGVEAINLLIFLITFYL
jgi:uncharacterized membrane protein